MTEQNDSDSFVRFRVPDPQGVQCPYQIATGKLMIIKVGDEPRPFVIQDSYQPGSNAKGLTEYHSGMNLADLTPFILQSAKAGAQLSPESAALMCVEGMEKRYGSETMLTKFNQWTQINPDKQITPPARINIPTRDKKLMAVEAPSITLNIGGEERLIVAVDDSQYGTSDWCLLDAKTCLNLGSLGPVYFDYSVRGKRLTFDEAMMIGVTEFVRQEGADKVLKKIHRLPRIN